ncbi:MULTISPECIES: pyruvate kinase [Aerococcus]|uniref:Pyruvate kinase n=1 Tax=Aerococcus mictus TaxID=2976810 RepID=A0ABZ2EEX6_9LACT|nr:MULTISPECIES: pyruvate kinase [Aerococcus]AEA00331.1 pyruvate kinase [Aerococcus sp. Group 1]MCY3030875.1 pyruvate kinase [Aerococcus sp. Group 1]MCY3055348.1 pyruvate kinase [Aerococcus sp. Group 1]MCY3057078.1 pyruvate kinase [Aerococcus sp. Group 1]MCY3062589.1 pyruvate kinase [Aerococcus sp. Group 1]
MPFDMKLLKKTKVVCTIGPASEDPETLVELAKAGMDVARMNFSHGDHDEHLARIKAIRQVEREAGKRIAVMLDTKGPEIRTHNMKDHAPVFLEKGKTVKISMTEVEGTQDMISVTYPQLINDVHVDSHILIDDGLVDLRVTDIDFDKGIVTTVVENSGLIKDKKGVNIPGVSVSLPGITEKDEADIRFGLENGIDIIAASFVRKPEDVLEIREILEETGNETVQIIPKIETQEGVDNIDGILQVSDGLMVARGDLGVEIPTEMVPVVQKELIRKCNAAGKPVITATQMLDSMQRNPRPTRAEASDVANAILDGTDAIMLSGETAAGDYPLEAVKTMTRIAMTTERESELRGQAQQALKEYQNSDVSEAIAQSVAHTARNLNIQTIVAATNSGHTARLISKYRPNAMILALTFSESRAHKLLLSRGVVPMVIEKPASTDEMTLLATQIAKEEDYAKDGDLILITAGVPVGETGTTNLMKIQMIGERLIEAQGLGNQSVIGHVVKAQSPEEAIEKANHDNILVVSTTDERYNEAIKKAGAVIVENATLTSHAAVMSVNTGTPVIVNAKDATNILEEGQLITLDARRGMVYDGATTTI